MQIFARKRYPVCAGQYRNEWKYICTEKEMAVLEARIMAVLERDIHSRDDSGGYEIHSLYFDDIKNSCAKENDAGDSQRFKYRIRYYGGQSDVLKLERKEKRNGRCHKEACSLSGEQYAKILSGYASEVIWETDEPLLKQFSAHCMSMGFRPKVIIDYQRKAYVDPVLNVRVTFDENISVSDDTSEFLSGDYLKIPLQDEHMHILEVKFDAILPSHIRMLMTNRCLVQTAFSKYYYGRKKLLEMGRR